LVGRVALLHDDPVTETASGETRAQRLLVVLGIVVLALNLRPAAVSVGPVLPELRAAFDMSATVAGILTTLPVLAFASFGAAAPALARRAGVHRVTLAALAAVVVGLGLRVLVDSTPAFLALSLLALAGMATANVLLPSLVKLHFPHRVGLLSSLYTTSLAIGLTMGSVLTVPVSEQLGSWRWGLGIWAATALVAAIPWLGLLRHDRAPEEQPHTVTLAQIARTRLGWVMAVLFGLQSLQAYSIFGWLPQVYRDAGFSPSTAGLLLGAVTAMSIPLSFLLPSVAARLRHQGVILTVLTACYPLGYLGLVLAPVGGAWLWAVLVGVAASVFPVVLTLIGLRARTPGGTAALSGFTQSVGYLIAAVGPFGVGMLYDVSGSWTPPLLVLAALAVPQIALGILASRPRFVEDELPRRVPAM
jgi:CP family cyanate transporter-like MFS transporter